MRGYGMNWVRTHIRNGSRLALFALAIQMVLAFGHLHAGHAHAASGTSVEQTQAPAGPGHDHHAADHCDICAVTAMSGTMLLGTPPALSLPPASNALLVVTAAEFGRIATARVAFQPRAPPLS
jgi:hypothetical protein